MSASLIMNLLVKMWWLLPLIIIAALIKSAWFKGIAGEFIINISAKLFLDKDKYHLFKNVTFPIDGGSTQIDHIIVSKYGIFVVETKNMKGWIFGNGRQKMWTQQIYKHRNRFQNPLHQNYKHTKVLGALLGLSKDQLISLVVFIGDSSFKTEMPENVTYGRGYIRFIKSKTQPILSESEVASAIHKIKNERLKPSLKTSRKHIRHVKEIRAKKV